MILLYLLLFFAFLRFGVVLANLLTKQWLSAKKVSGMPSVSVLIPARNEEANIGRVIRNILQTQDDGSVNLKEILVYDDHSSDGTASLVEEMSKTDARVRLIRGGQLPEGWLGKNHACHRLGEEAAGDWLLFLDADVEVAPGLIRDSVGYAQKHQVRLLSIFPRQIMKTTGEWMVVPLMNWILVSLLPMVMVRTCRWTSFSGANGQFMLFDSVIYKRFRWHELVKSDPVEDIRISRLMKKKRFRTATLLSGGQISCRMYESREQAVNGFSKNIGQFFGNSLIWMLTFTLLTTLAPLTLVILSSFFRLSSLAFYLYLLLALLVKTLTTLLSRQNLFKNLFFWIPQLIMLPLLVWKSVRYRFGGKIEWKGRQV
jgi:cellulose synthase/poly-beta-1,6-N-acetylglucosamine synthase-like glycosyltransferase